jgi:hypothetical protein
MDSKNKVVPALLFANKNDSNINKTFGNLTVEAKDTIIGGNNWHPYYICFCNIHNKYYRVRIDNLLSGQTTGCDLCANDARRISRTLEFNYTNSPIFYNKWMAIVRKCTNPIDPKYSRWGALGYTISQEWKDSFVNFVHWMHSKGIYEEDLLNGRNLFIRLIKGQSEFGPNNCFILNNGVIIE